MINARLSLLVGACARGTCGARVRLGGIGRVSEDFVVLSFVVRVFCVLRLDWVERVRCGLGRAGVYCFRGVSDVF